MVYGGVSTLHRISTTYDYGHALAIVPDDGYMQLPKQDLDSKKGSPTAIHIAKKSFAQPLGHS